MESDILSKKTDSLSNYSDNYQIVRKKLLNNNI